MSLLSRPLQLHDVEDVEAHVWRTISSSADVAGLRPHERDDLCAYLIGVAWELGPAYDPARGRVTFSSFLGTTARLRIINWIRKERGRSKWSWSNGRSYERERPRVLSLEAELDSVVDALGPGTGDPPPDSDEDLGRLFAERDRARARDLDLLRERPYRRPR
jgi:DNA-directed RNA polymerase specialized sigma24 family protein